MTERTEDITELTHEPVPGYRKAFFIALAIGVVYLGIVLGSTVL